MIVYTIGNTKSYNESIKNNPETKKLGRSKNYSGGWVWKLKQDALDFLNSSIFAQIDWGDGKSRNPKDFSVYGIIVDSWEKNVSEFPEEDSVHRLLVDSKLVMLEDNT